MWKDFFYYSRSERRAVYVLLTLITLLLTATFIYTKREQTLADSLASRTEEMDMLLTGSRVSKNVAPKENGRRSGKVGKAKELFEFNPNLADSIELSRLGLTPFVVKNILKYRQKGGRFVSPSSFARVYGLSSEQFKELVPYIRIPVLSSDKKQILADSSVQRRMNVSRTLSVKYPEGTVVDVNVADTTELKKIPGIGSVIARSIVAYRERLGGFYELNQLLEIRWVTPELLEWFTLGDKPVTPLALNRAGLDKLRAHPYLDFYQAKVIVEHRRKKGKITSLSQLALYEEFTEKDLKRLSAYCNFD